MKLTGYSPMLTFSVNHRIDGISGSGKIICCGKAVCDVARSAEINLSDDLILGANLRKGSKAESYLKIKNNGKLNINGRFQVFFGAGLEVFENAVLTLGKSYINTGGAIACASSITIGDGVFIGRNTYITDSDHHDIYNKQGEKTNRPEAVTIGDHVLIGFGAIILKGVTVGNGAVISAGAVVTNDIPEGCMVAGVPAKVIREGVIWK